MALLGRCCLCANADQTVFLNEHSGFIKKFEQKTASLILARDHDREGTLTRILLHFKINVCNFCMI